MRRRTVPRAKQRHVSRMFVELQELFGIETALFLLFFLLLPLIREMPTLSRWMRGVFRLILLLRMSTDLHMVLHDMPMP